MSSNNFPTDSEVKEYVRNNLDQFMLAVRGVMGELSDDYINNVKIRKRGWNIVGSALFVLFAGFVAINYVFWLGLLLISLAIISLILGIRMISSGVDAKMLEMIKKAHKALLLVIASNIGVKTITLVEQIKKDRKAFNVTANETDQNNFQKFEQLANASLELSTTYEYDELVEKLEKSVLVSEMQGKIKTLLMAPVIYKIEADSKDITFAQIQGRPFIGKTNDRDLQVFVNKMSKSLFIHVPLSQTFSGTTVVTTEKFSDGNEQNYYINALRRTGLNISELEWNDFESLLHVLTNDEVEARYILTPDFMQSLYLWWQEKKQDIRISFTGDTMNILIFGNEVSFGGDLTDVSEEGVRLYVESLMVPLIHSLYLINAYSVSR